MKDAINMTVRILPPKKDAVHMTVRILPPNLINQIAAGEVVERPASVVKELVENALDAGATHIDITMNEGGRSLIVVSDDGAGMDDRSLALAVERYATSKLPDDDLIDIGFFGFRGEALPSIGAVARLKITSRTREGSSAWYVMVAGGRRDGPVPAPHPRGTRVEVRDLFYATPARLKFLKAARTELNHAVDILNRLAMAHPYVAFTLNADGRTRLSLDAEIGELFDARLARLGAVVGKDFIPNAVPVDAGRDGFRLTGYAGVPTYNRRNALSQYMFVNGRPVRDRLLHGAARGAYQDFLASNRHPYLALFLECPPQEVDVNVHPAKAEVRFRDAGKVRGLIVGALKHALAEAGHQASTTVSDAALGAMRPEGSGLPQRASHSLFSAAQAGQAPLHSTGPGTGLAESQMNYDGAPTAAVIEGGDEAGADFPLGVARAQVHETYIVAQSEDGLVIVDQHAAHERLVYERMKAMLADKGINRQLLLLPEVVELDEAAAQRLADRAEELAELGLVLEAFGDGAVVVREVPALLGETDVQGLVKDLADEVPDFGEALALKDKLADVCGTMACHSSIRAGRRLGGPEMNALLREMEQTPHAGQCNHGRPTYVTIKLTDIEQLFGRR